MVGQLDSADVSVNETAQNWEDKELDLKPYVSLGAGPMTYYGDMFRYPGTNAVMGNWGFKLGLGVHATNYLDAELFYSSGWIAFNENTIDRHANFKSKIISGGLLFTYNFDNFFKQSPAIHPLFILGISNVEFNSKTDLKDAYGRQYNYWSDGSIRSLPESSPDAQDAVVLIKDNYYESDLRSLNTDDNGDYALHALAIPVGIGADISLDKGFSMRITSVMNFTFTDNIDNITGGGNDRYLYTSVSLSYDIPPVGAFKKSKLDGLMAGEDDEDGDGVIDLWDDCPFTPEGVQVDEKGCPLDGDGDWVPDYKDDELNTPLGSVVDTSGVAYTDEQLYELYLAYMDTVGTYTNIIKTVYTSNEKGYRTKHTPRPKGEEYYTVQVANSTEDLTIDQIGKILSITNVSVLNDSTGSYYHVGNYKELELAVEQKIILELDGINGEVMGLQDDQRVKVGPEAKDIEDNYRLEGGFSGSESLISKDVIYRVQIGAFKNPISRNVFDGVDDLIELQGDDGLTRYLTGSYRTIEKAASRKIDVLLDGFEGAFIVAYKNGKRVSLQSAGHVVDESAQPAPENSMDKEKVRFKVQVGAYKERVPADVMDKMISIGDVKTVRQGDLTRYLVGDYKSYEEANQRKEELIAEGLDAFVVGSFNEKIITVEEATEILNK
jgi:cell division protein FtsN